MKRKIKKKEGYGKLIREIFGEDWPDRGWRRPSIASIAYIPSISDLRRIPSTSSAPSIPTIKQSLRDHLLQTPLFIKDEKCGIVFYDIKNQRKRPKTEADRLLDLLVVEMYLFLDSNTDKIADFITKHPAPHPAVEALRDSIPAFIAAGVKEKSLIKTIKQVGMWAHKSYRHDQTNLHKVNGRDLIKPLFDIFETVPRLGKDGIHLSIAHVLKEFRLESGDVDKIYTRIKKHSTRNKIV